MRGAQPIFQFQGNPLLKATFIRDMKVKFDSAGFDSDAHSGHSLRRGGCQDLYMAHVPMISPAQVDGPWVQSPSPDIAR